jgi:protein phosphatase-4 regulatory subunit 3
MAPTWPSASRSRRAAPVYGEHAQQWISGLCADEDRDFVNEVQSRLQALAQGTSNNAHGFLQFITDTSDCPTDDTEHSSPIMLPSPDLGNLHEIENHMRAANSTPGGREALGKFILAQDYIPKLIPLVDMAEDLESVSDLHRLCSIMKMLILLNDTAIIEYVVTDPVVLGVVGALECECSPMRHTTWLR